MTNTIEVEQYNLQDYDFATKDDHCKILFICIKNSFIQLSSISSASCTISTKRCASRNKNSVQSKNFGLGHWATNQMFWVNSKFKSISSNK